MKAGRPKKHTKESLIKALQSLGKTHVSKKDVDKNPSVDFGSMTIIRYFGSWNQGLREAGLKPGIRTGRKRKNV